MQLVNIDERENYQSVFLKLRNSYQKISSWLLYGNSSQMVLRLARNFAGEVLNYVNDDLLEVISDNIRVNEIRSVINFLSKTSSRNGYKVVIISDIINMNNNAANAILKILEEPPEKSIILMISRSLFAVPNTIKSRCCKLHLPEDNNVSLSEEDTTLYKKFLEAYKNGSRLPEDNFVQLMQILILRLLKIKSGVRLVNEFFSDEELELKNCSCNVGDLFNQWENILQLNQSKANFHLAEQQINILLCNNFGR